MPDITVFMNCDTRLAINLRTFNLGAADEFIFAIKNYSYIDSSYVFLFRARAADMDENGEVIFKITPAASKQLKPGAIYNFAVLQNAFDRRKETEYRKLTDNGNIIIEYGAQDLIVYDESTDVNSEVVAVRLERISDEDNKLSSNKYMGEISGIRLEYLED
jgi:hypothetical protein